MEVNVQYISEQPTAKRATVHPGYVGPWHEMPVQPRACERTESDGCPTAEPERQFTTRWQTRFRGGVSVYK